MYSVKSFLLTPFFCLKKCLLLYGFMLFIPFLGHGQENARDSIKKQLRQTTAPTNFDPRDTLYINLVNGLAKEMRYYKNDSLFHLSQQALELSKSAQL